MPTDVRDFQRRGYVGVVPRSLAISILEQQAPEMATWPIANVQEGQLLILAATKDGFRLAAVPI